MEQLVKPPMSPMRSTFCSFVLCVKCPASRACACAQFAKTAMPKPPASARLWKPSATSVTELIAMPKNTSAIEKIRTITPMMASFWPAGTCSAGQFRPPGRTHGRTHRERYIENESQSQAAGGPCRNTSDLRSAGTSPRGADEVADSPSRGNRITWVQ